MSQYEIREAANAYYCQDNIICTRVQTYSNGMADFFGKENSLELDDEEIDELLNVFQ